MSTRDILSKTQARDTCGHRTFVGEDVYGAQLYYNKLKTIILQRYTKKQKRRYLNSCA